MAAIENLSRPHTFQTSKPERFWNLRLLIAAVAAIVLHVFCFYVFQVQEAKVSRVLPETSHVTLLSARNPASTAILRQLDDYYAAFTATLDPGSSLNAPLPMPESDRVKQRNYIDLMPSPFSENPISNNALLRSSLPPVNHKGIEPDGDSMPAYDLTYSPSIRHRALTRSLPLDAETRKSAPANAWRVAITPTGAVHYLFPVDGKPPSDNSKLRQAIRDLRFQAASGNGKLQWGTITYTPSPIDP